MSILNFSEDKYIKTFDSNEEVRLGGFSVAPGSAGPIGNVRVFIYINDFTSLGGSETLTMKLYTSTNYSNAYVTSNAASLSDITFDTSDGSKTNYLGYVKFDFNNEWLNPNATYYPTVTIANYTPSGDTFYIGLCYDFPDGVYSDNTGQFFTKPIQTQIFTKTQRTT